MFSERDQEVFQFLEEYERLRGIEEYWILDTIMEMKSNFQLFKSNLIDFRKSCHDFYSDKSLMRNDKLLKRWRIQKRISRHLFNTLVSADSFIDYAASKKRKLNFDFNDHLKRNIRNNKEYQLLRILRNKVTHGSQLRFANSKSFKRLDEAILIQTTFKIKKSEFTETAKRQSKKYPKGFDLLKSYEEEFDLIPLLSSVEKSLDDFYNWLLLSFVKANTSSFNKMVSSFDSFHQKHSYQMTSSNYPPNRFQMRYLKYLLKRSEVFNS